MVDETRKWTEVAQQLPELTERDHFGQPIRRVFFVVSGHVWDGECFRSFGDRLVFSPNNISVRGFPSEEVSHWMPNPLPAPPDFQQNAPAQTSPIPS